MKVISILTIIAAMLYLYLTVTAIKSNQRTTSTWLLAISKYQFLNITPENVTRHILESVDELVVLIDFDGRPTYLNKKAKTFLRIR